MPCAGAPTVVTVSVSPSTSESLASTSSAVAPSSATVAASLAATGASLTGTTVSETVATFESAVAVVGDEGEGVRAVVVRVGRVRPARRPTRTESRGPARRRSRRRAGRRRRPSRAAATSAKLSSARIAEFAVATGGSFTGVDRDRHRRDVRVVDAVGRLEREGVGAVEVRRRRIRPARARAGERAVRGRRDERVRERVAVSVRRAERERQRRVLVGRRALGRGHRRAVVVRDRALALPVLDVAAGRIGQVDDEELVELVVAVSGDVDGERPARDCPSESSASRTQARSPRPRSPSRPPSRSARCSSRGRTRLARP